MISKIIQIIGVCFLSLPINLEICPCVSAINKIERLFTDEISIRSGLVEPPTRTDKPIITPIAPTPDEAR